MARLFRVARAYRRGWELCPTRGPVVTEAAATAANE
eukprot:CAMPEP_0171072260 /NCGR_PEP_ID=MMETSP0766_2-20121228/10757_1 /TAXON_ID=439317 /ORGANISM="Gambierdiscus australes, Strain CAWD 149" /LENGTH=35 /DNA_ID= /DNA_START= /DNA_END= /DNA_ORIENTATION=